MKKPIKLVYGYGINDADYVVMKTINKKRIKCPFYSTWSHMMERVYSNNYHKRFPTYKNTTVCGEWHRFTKFKSWMETQEWEGLQLDKDILYPDNKHYSSKTCTFVPSYINNLLIDSGKARGAHPIGVVWNKRDNKFQANIKKNGKLKHLGYYDTATDAHKVYIRAKIDYVKSFYPIVDDRVKDGLKRHIKNMKKGLS